MSNLCPSLLIFRLLPTMTQTDAIILMRVEDEICGERGIGEGKDGVVGRVEWFAER